jgi:hypothetical protein
MSVTEPDFGVGRDLFWLEKFFRELEKLRRVARVRYGRRITPARLILYLKIDSDNGSEPREQVGQDFPAQPGIPLSGDGDRPFGVDGK